jgi:hypothetical protein
MNWSSCIKWMHSWHYHLICWKRTSSSDVVGWASSPEPTKPSPDEGLQWAQAQLQISEAQAWGSSSGFNTLWFGVRSSTGSIIWLILNKLKSPALLNSDSLAFSEHDLTYFAWIDRLTKRQNPLGYICKHIHGLYMIHQHYNFNLLLVSTYQ